MYIHIFTTPQIQFSKFASKLFVFNGLGLHRYRDIAKAFCELLLNLSHPPPPALSQALPLMTLVIIITVHIILLQNISP